MNDLFNITTLNPLNDEISSPISLRLMDNAKGSSIFLNSTESIHTVAVIEFPKGGEVRGNHYHKTKREYLYIMEGILQAYFWRPGEEIIQEIILNKGDFLTLHPNLGHAFKGIERTMVFELGNKGFDPLDTVYDPRIT
jgi:quercetin dioxygenase-like cupin family protein